MLMYMITLICLERLFHNVIADDKHVILCKTACKMAVILI